MALTPQYSDTMVNAQADAAAALLDNGYIRVYDGTQPTTADDPITTHVLLAELRFGNPAFAAAVAGVITANPITSDASANATGDATWARCLASDGTTVIMDGSVGVADANVILNTTDIVASATISCSALTLTVAKGGELIQI